MCLTCDVTFSLGAMCNNVLLSFLTVGSTLCNALDNVGTVTLNMYQSSFVVLCSSLQYSLSRRAKHRFVEQHAASA